MLNCVVGPCRAVPTDWQRTHMENFDARRCCTRSDSRDEFWTAPGETKNAVVDFESWAMLVTELKQLEFHIRYENCLEVRWLFSVFFSIHENSNWTPRCCDSTNDIRWNWFAHALHHLYVMLAETRYFFSIFFFGEMCVISRYNDYIVYTRSMEINSRRSAQQV